MHNDTEAGSFFVLFGRRQCALTIVHPKSRITPQTEALSSVYHTIVHYLSHAASNTCAATLPACLEPQPPFSMTTTKA